jgi:hypothetical protein
MDLGALAERLPGVLREGSYDPAFSPALSRTFADEAALGLELRSTGRSAGLGSRAERASFSARLASDDVEAVAVRKREALAAQLEAASAGGGGGRAAAPAAKAATRGAAHSLFVMPSATATPYGAFDRASKHCGPFRCLTPAPSPAHPPLPVSLLLHRPRIISRAPSCHLLRSLVWRCQGPSPRRGHAHGSPAEVERRSARLFRDGR